MVVDDENAGGHGVLIGSDRPADKTSMNRGRSDLQAWLWGEILLCGLLGASLALLVSHPALRTQYDKPALLLVIETALSSAAFAIGPALGGGTLDATQDWTALVGATSGTALVAAAPFARGRSRARHRALWDSLAAAAVALLGAWLLIRAHAAHLPALTAGAGESEPPGLASALTVQTLIDLLAVLGWGRRLARTGDDLARWLALGFTLLLFAALHLVFSPPRGTTYVAEGEFLRLLAYGVMVVGAWRAIRAAELGRAVAEERARIAREIHDGLAQYLFALSTHAQMLEAGAPVAEVGPQLKEAAALAQQEARFAVLALSSAGGSAPFDAALSRYVEFLTADGELEVDLEIDPHIRLAPDEQIEIFRIVQEGLGNARRHAQARRAEVVIGRRASGERFVAIADDGSGFEGDAPGASQGLRNMRERAASIDGGFSLRSTPGRGTSLEVVLRT
jgi:signal transduction histidine kinase